jgi:mRNA interferase MazF
MDPVRGHEQAGTRPVLIVSSDVMNHAAGKLVMVVPLTRTPRRNPRTSAFCLPRAECVM